MLLVLRGLVGDLAAIEKLGDFFQRQIFRLWEEEIDDGEVAHEHAAPNDEIFPANFLLGSGLAAYLYWHRGSNLIHTNPIGFTNALKMFAPASPNILMTEVLALSPYGDISIK